MYPDYAITKEIQEEDRLVVIVDTNKATFQGFPWATLGDFGKRKFENMLVLSRPTERIKVQYA